MAPFSRTLVFVSLLLGSLAGGCARRSVEGEGDDDVASTEAELADDASEDLTAANHSNAFGRVFILPLDKAAVADIGKAALALKAKQSLVFAGFLPFKCGTLTSTGLDLEAHRASFHASFDDCDGPFELAHVSGGLDGVLQKTDESFTLSLEGGADLRGNGQPITFEAQAQVSVDGDDPDTARRNSTWNARWSGSTKKGTTVTHTAVYSVSIDPQTRCADIAGVTRGTVGQKGLSMVTELYGVCQGKCIQSGSITATSQKTGRSIVIRFDGTSQALVVAPKHSFTLPLKCEM